MEENKNTPKRRIAQMKMTILFSSIVEVILAIMEIYIIINYKASFIAIALVAICMVVALFFLVTGIIDLNLINNEAEREKYDEIYNAQKASYLIIRKSFEEMDERLRSIEESSSLPADEIINAQKAVAKVTISRSKENTEALMNSNDELINQMFNFQEKLDGNIEQQQQILESTKADLLRNNQELNEKLKQIEQQVNQMQSGVVMAQPVVQQAPVYVAAPEPVVPAPTPEPIITEPVSPEPAAVEPEIAEEQILEPVVEEVVETEILEPEVTEEIIPEAPVEDTMPDLGVEDLGSLDIPLEENLEAAEESLEPAVESIDDLLAGIELPTEEVSDEELSDTDIDSLLDSLQVDELAMEQEVTEEPAPVEEAVPEIPVEEPEPVIEPEPEPEPEPVVEEAPPAEPEVIEIPDVGIDLSDPNRVMSPEEIEKLFANL